MDRDRVLAERMMVLCRENPRATAIAGYGHCAEAGGMGGEQEAGVHRLWREEGLKVPDKQRKRQRLLLEGTSENGCARRRAEHEGHLWS